MYFFFLIVDYTLQRNSYQICGIFNSNKNGTEPSYNFQQSGIISGRLWSLFIGHCSFEFGYCFVLILFLFHVHLFLLHIQKIFLFHIELIFLCTYDFLYHILFIQCLSLLNNIHLRPSIYILHHLFQLFSFMNHDP